MYNVISPFQVTETIYSELLIKKKVDIQNGKYWRGSHSYGWPYSPNWYEKRSNPLIKINLGPFEAIRMRWYSNELYFYYPAIEIERADLNLFFHCRLAQFFLHTLECTFDSGHWTIGWFLMLNLISSPFAAFFSHDE